MADNTNINKDSNKQTGTNTTGQSTSREQGQSGSFKNDSTGGREREQGGMTGEREKSEKSAIGGGDKSRSETGEAGRARSELGQDQGRNEPTSR